MTCREKKKRSRDFTPRTLSTFCTNCFQVWILLYTRLPVSNPSHCVFKLKNCNRIRISKIRLVHLLPKADDETSSSSSGCGRFFLVCLVKMSLQKVTTLETPEQQSTPLLKEQSRATSDFLKRTTCFHSFPRGQEFNNNYSQFFFLFFFVDPLLLALFLFLSTEKCICLLRHETDIITHVSRRHFWMGSSYHVSRGLFLFAFLQIALQSVSNAEKSGEPRSS